MGNQISLDINLVIFGINVFVIGNNGKLNKLDINVFVIRNNGKLNKFRY